MNAGNRLIMQQTLTKQIDEWWNGDDGIQAKDGIYASGLPYIGEDTFALMAKSAVLILEAIVDSQETAIADGFLQET